jgi:Protein of unknown function (DUF3108)
MQAKMIKIMTTLSVLILLTMAFSTINAVDETHNQSYPLIHVNNPAVVGTDLTTIDLNPCTMKNQVFQGEEVLTYSVYYNWNFIWIPAGEVIFKVTDKGNQYHLSAQGRTYSSYEWFFKVRDNYDTYVDKKSLLPIIGIRDVQEGGYSLYDKITFQQDQRKAFSLRGKHKDKAILREFSVDACMHDLLSVLYYTRNLDFKYIKEGDTFPVKIFMDKQVWPLNVKFKGREEGTDVKGIGSFNTIKISPELISGEVFAEGAEMNIWATDDQNKLPLLVESPVSVGSVKAVLQGYSNLRYPVTAKVK